MHFNKVMSMNQFIPRENFVLEWLKQAGATLTTSST